jgi:tRNA modification GTPase
MNVFAAVMTGNKIGAIATIQLCGDCAQAVVKQIFEPIGGEDTVFAPGKIRLGTITHAGQAIDQVVLGCEGADNFTINCHGNPLIVEDIMKLLAEHGVQPVTSGQLYAKILAAEELPGTIALEAKLAQASSLTLEGTILIANQIEGGLAGAAARWLEQMDAMSLDTIKDVAGGILSNSEKAGLIINGCRAVIAGPPNSGKSTLFNYLCGKQKAIVSDIRGTTRDWLSARCRVGPLSVELVDTAGLDSNPAASSTDNVELASRQRTLEMLQSADLVLLVLDAAEAENTLGPALLENIAGKKVLTLLNKADLAPRLDFDGLGQMPRNMLRISAKLGTGIPALLNEIPNISGVAGFDLHNAVCFTPRQHALMKLLHRAPSKQDAVSIITELLNGRADV